MVLSSSMNLDASKAVEMRTLDGRWRYLNTLADLSFAETDATNQACDRGGGCGDGAVCRPLDRGCAFVAGAYAEFGAVHCGPADFFTEADRRAGAHAFCADE